MAVPDFQSIMLPLLRLAADGTEHTTASAIETLAVGFKLVETDRQELLPGGGQRRFNNRVYWASAHLRAAGLLSSPARGRFVITDSGRDVLQQDLSKIDMRFLSQFPDYADFKAGSAGTVASAPAPATVEPQTPDEIIATAHAQLEDQLATDVLSHVMAAPPSFFEQLVLDLLSKMGYAGPLAGAAQVVGGPGDGGIDGIIREDRLGLDLIYDQAKRWSGQVGRPDVQSFVGSLEGKHASRGVFLTTSTFSGEARGYADNLSKRVILIDGAMLAKLMVEHGVGVSTRQTYAIKRVDTDYFEAG